MSSETSSTVKTELGDSTITDFVHGGSLYFKQTRLKGFSCDKISLSGFNSSSNTTVYSEALIVALASANTHGHWPGNSLTLHPVMWSQPWHPCFKAESQLYVMSLGWDHQWVSCRYHSGIFFMISRLLRWKAVLPSLSSEARADKTQCQCLTVLDPPSLTVLSGQRKSHLNYIGWNCNNSCGDIPDVTAA